MWNSARARRARARGYKNIDIGAILSLDDKRKTILQEVESLRQERNTISAKMKGNKPSSELINQGKKIKTILSDKEHILSMIEEELNQKLKSAH